MNTSRHYRQLFMFVVVLILPSVLVAWLGWTNIALDRQNRLNEAQRTATAARNSTRAEIGKDLWDRLENIKSREIGPSVSSDAEVSFIAFVDGNRLVMPWESDPNAEGYRTSMKDAAFIAKKEEAERAEREHSLDRARGLYVDLIQSASNDNQRAYTRLKLAAVLRRLGATPEAAAYFRDLVDLPSNLVDEEGYSFASIAAGGLVSMNTADHDVLKRVARDLATPAALTVDQTLRWQDILAALQNSRDYAVGAEAKMALATISAQLVKLQQIRKDIEQDRDFSDLRNDFRKLTVTERAWTPYGDMLLSRATAGPASRPLIIGVRRERVFAVVRAPHTSGGQFELAVGSGSGEYLDAQRFSDLKIVFPAVGTATESSPNLRRTFYASILLVVSLNLFGGYLLWRDTRREMRVAELRSQFVSSVSHELKTPLTSIRMFAEILQMGNARDEVTNRECLDTIVNESERLTRLLNNVLDFSRIEHGQKTYRMEPTRLADIVAAAAKTMQYPLAEQGFDLRLEVDQQIPTVDADRDALKQAVLNLLTNAMKYSGQSRFIELRLFPQNGDAMIQVVDHGIGIPAGEQSRIFERFYRAPVAENRSISGTGLGLALVAHIAEAHGGSVQVESALGDGSTFSIRIPTHSGGSS